MTQHLYAIPISAAFIGAVACYAAAWNLSGHTGRRVLAFGLDLESIFRSRQGRHRETAMYDGEAVHTHDHRTEEERQAEYQRLRDEAVTAVISVSAAPLVDFTAELKALNELDMDATYAQPHETGPAAALRRVVQLHDELASIELQYAELIRQAIADARAGDLVTV